MHQYKNHLNLSKSSFVFSCEVKNLNKELLGTSIFTTSADVCLGFKN
jgi:hypothetical protein